MVFSGNLAPIKFKRCMETLESSNACVEIDDWSNEKK